METSNVKHGTPKGCLIRRNTMYKKILEYTTIIMSVIGTFCMIGAVGSIEIDKWLQGGSMAMLGIASFILALYSQILYSEEK